MKKQTSHAFNKDIYLMGINQEGRKVWLEAPSWDCEWYWGFGYIETYTNNASPGDSKDIESHQHINSSVMGQMFNYDYENGKEYKGEYIHNIYESPFFKSVTFSESEGWELSELFKQFYTLRESAEMFGRGSCHISTSKATQGVLKRKEWADTINQDIIPQVTKRILEILTP